jgi:hypothetical protein
MWYLAIVFIINGEVTVLDGWNPMLTNSEAHCEQLQQTTTDYLDSLNLEYEFVVSCEKK